MPACPAAHRSRAAKGIPRPLVLLVCVTSGKVETCSDLLGEIVTQDRVDVLRSTVLRSPCRAHRAAFIVLRSQYLVHRTTFHRAAFTAHSRVRRSIS